MKYKQSDIQFMQSDKLVESHQVFDGKIMQVYVNKLAIEPEVVVERELIHHQPAVAVLPVLSDQRVILVKQYRAAVDRDLYEIPAGILDLVDGEYEEALVGARRELEEETGYQAAHWQSIGGCYVSPGFLDEYIELFLARGLTEVEEPLAQDPHENVTHHIFSRAQVQAMLADGDIIDAKTIVALQHWLLAIEQEA